MREDPEIFTFNVERCFDVMEVTDDATRIRLATFMLDGRAAKWWQDLGPRRAVTWDEFKNELTLSVLPRSVRDKKADQFSEFEQ